MPKHQLSQTPDSRYTCAICSQTWKREPYSDNCPGVKVYAWGAWGQDLLTKKQMSDAGFQVGAKLPKPAGAVSRSESPGGWMWLYNRADGVPKRQMSEAQKAAVAKAAEVARIGWTCRSCGYRLRWYQPGGGLCKECQLMEMVRQDHENAKQWARDLLDDPDSFVILDSETTGLDAGYNEIIQLAVMSGDRLPLLNTLIKPEYPERMYEKTGWRSAHDIHGIDAERLVDAPKFPQIYLKLREVIRGKLVVIYNDSFDIGFLNAACKQYQLPRLKARHWMCAMHQYAAWCGEWNHRRGSYRWQALNGGHDALGDCEAVLDVLKTMAGVNELSLIEKLMAWQPEAINAVITGRCDVCHKGDLVFYQLPDMVAPADERGRVYGGYWCARCGFSNAGSRQVVEVKSIENAK